ncbi:UvrD/REP helicase [Desulfamplus magnetovallimortis]|uniref:DNA 3'-5' helicase n=1 Tax=Desulfamplus magnetovallimortis TaxID=1246637 RepID=A0A1W1HEJ8_9BACT|nr:ATP-dependent helicase [Desulfamplus magnetovallimortis]SLM30917.1 UvrD/REP helicase [Desulfamplus magnetovallimortis]
MQQIKLNPRQRASAEFLYGTACTISIPGAGKTLTMATRISLLIKKHNVSPESILGLTFTRNAARSMQEKLLPILNEEALRVKLMTTHSFAYSLLKQEGYTFEILSGIEQIKFLRQIMKNLKIRHIPTGLVLSEINLSKSNMVSIEDFKAVHADNETMSAIGAIYDYYEKSKKKKLLKDFNDLLLETYNLLSSDDEIREKYHRTFSHILVDEFQDTFPLQAEVVKLLIYNGKRTSFWVCGDDSQSIYSFTGGNISNILNFDKIFPDCQRFILDVNYRSTPEILDVCQKLIDNNVKKIDKKLQTNNKSGDKPVIIEAANEDDEAVQIVNEVKALTQKHGHSYEFKDIAVLYRANSLSRPIEDSFKQHDIPYHIENAQSFYQRFEVKVLLDYLKFIDDPDSHEGDEALGRVLNIPNRYIGKTLINELDEYCEKNNVSLYEALKRMPINLPYLKKIVRKFVGFMGQLIRDKNQLEPAEMLYLLREGLEYDKFISDDDVPSIDNSKMDNINQLTMVAGKYQNISDLINYTETFREEISNNKEGVSLMTIHKSKGLEYPVVFLIGLMEGMLPHKQGEIEEERRVTFVGMSRAMEKLYLSYPMNYSGKNMKRSRFLDEILT